MMKKIKIFLILLVLFISISAVSAEGNFTTLQDEIHTSTERIEINQNYILLTLQIRPEFLTLMEIT